MVEGWVAARVEELETMLVIALTDGIKCPSSKKIPKISVILNSDFITTL
jgi:hypothetical protein